LHGVMQSERVAALPKLSCCCPRGLMQPAERDGHCSGRGATVNVYFVGRADATRRVYEAFQFAREGRATLLY
jgi:hypothetical protein